MSLHSWLRSLRARIALPNTVRRLHSDAPRAVQLSEVLEPRCLLAVTPVLINGTDLQVQLESGDDVSIQSDPSGKLQVLSNSAVVIGNPDILTADITSITVNGGDGSNFIDLTNVTTADFATNLPIAVNGNDGNDTILGSEFADNLFGGHGNDSITGALENDTLDGGHGNDVIDGGVGNDSIIGGDGADSIHGDTGDDTVNAGDGADQVFGDDGLDLLNGGDGSDTLNGDIGNDTLNGDNGNDSLIGGDDDDLIFGGAGNDTAAGSGGLDTINGGADDDSLNGDEGTDIINGDDGNDTLLGGDSNDTINGGSGNDSVHGNDGNDSVFGGGGNDSLIGDAGDDTLLGQAGNDILNGGGGADSLDGGAGNDLLNSGLSSAVLIPNVSVNDVTIVEGNAGTTTALVTVVLSQTTTVPVSLQVTTSDNIALAGVDYTAVNSTLTIPAGQTTGTISISIVPDTIYEATETFFVNLSAPVNGTLTDTQATVTITNDDTTAATQVVFIDFNSQTSGNDHVYTPQEQTSILNRLQAIYAAFPVQFVATAPAAAPFTTVVINQTRFGSPGLADEIDFRNTNLNSFATVDITGLLGGLGAPPATSANIVELTVKITAHELGHTVGLRHNDSFGPIGSGIGGNVTANLFTPAYPGPANATETTRHISASPASVGETLFDAISGQFFGEREAVKLSAWAFGGSVIAEQAGAHDTVATAQPIQFRELFVPNTLVSGANLGQTFRVNQMTVTGAIGVGGERDTYSFQGTAGQLLNFEVISDILVAGNSTPGHFAAGIDSVIRILDANGAVIPYYAGTAQNNNGTDSGFPDTDSVLIDLILPSTGTFYIEVSAATGADIGNYELYGFDFATYIPAAAAAGGAGGIVVLPPEPGDTMLGGDGNDTIIGGDGDDLINGMSGHDSLAGGAGNDSIFGGSGIDTIDGQAGDDLLNGQSGNDFVAGGDGQDEYVWNGAGDGVDYFSSLSGYDKVRVQGTAAANNFVVSHSNGQLQISDGTAVLNVSPVIQVVDILAGGGNDTITIGALDRVRTAMLLTINGGDGNDTINMNGANAGLIRLSLIGGVGDDSLTGSSANDSLDGGDGDDRLDGQGGNDQIIGGRGDDQIFGGTGNDRIFAGDGSDSIDAGTGDDSVSGDLGADTINGVDGNDTLDGGDGTDSINGGAGHDSILGGNEADNLNGSTGNDTIRGGANDDTIFGENGNDKLYGDDGNDSILGHDGDDTINGGDGNDTLDGMVGNDLVGGGDGDDLMNGAAGNDTLTGDDGNDTIAGGAGADVLIGGEGDDFLNGQGSSDTINPGEGNDTVIAPSTEIDTTFTLSNALLAALA